MILSVIVVVITINNIYFALSIIYAITLTVKNKHNKTIATSMHAAMLKMILKA